MDDDFLLSIARMGVQVGMHLVGQAPEPPREIDDVDIANAIIGSSAQQAYEIISRLGIGQRIDIDRGEFGVIVGIIAREHFSLAEALTGRELSLSDGTVNAGEICLRAYRALLRN